ncbi:hypothetical protein H4R21_002161 [Coemansia helicoidea]|uniref:Uncharacterized protein n=1 Tax=Coemansia helicoidea TaxID=1286919 RepID=A0ACC1L8D8_9FUNG|nr:hypothetical protein H4R21_002161 [Coemansia helicoidea]
MSHVVMLRIDNSSYAFVEFESAGDATAARSKLHHSRLFGSQLEVHFETKVPQPFRQMLEGARRSRSPSHNRAPRTTDHSPELSPADPRYPAERGHMRHASHAAPYDKRDRPDAMRGTHGAPPPPPAYSRPVYANRGGADERDAPRYHAQQQRPPYRAYNARREQGDYQFRHEAGDYGAGYSSQPRATYGDRAPYNPERYNAYHEPRRRDSRSMSPGRRDGRSASPVRGNDRLASPERRDGQEPQTSGGSWSDDRPPRSRNEHGDSGHRSHSHGPAPERQNSAWDLEMTAEVPPVKTPTEAGHFNEDSLFAAP